MALTKIGTDGVKDDAVTSGKIPANAVGSSELADNSVDTNAIQANAVTNAKIGDTEITGNKLADQAVSLDKLPHGTSSNDGKFLRANNGADPSFEDIPAGGIPASGGTFTGDITVSGGASALTVAADSEIKLVNGTTDTGDPGSSGSKIQLLNNVTTLRCGASGAKAVSNTGTSLWEINPSGVLQPAFNNFFPIGDASNQVTKIFLSQGVQLGGTGNANLLQDYEEGTWTPKLKKYANGGWQDASMNSNGTVHKNRYVKIGSVVTCHLHWDGWQNGDANYATMGDLPFPCSSTGGGFGMVTYTDAFVNNPNLGIYINGNSSTMSFYHGSYAWNGWSSSSNRNIHLMVTYITDA